MGSPLREGNQFAKIAVLRAFTEAKSARFSLRFICWGLIYDLARTNIYQTTKLIHIEGSSQ